MANNEMLDLVMSKIIADQEHWDQGVWRAQLDGSRTAKVVDEDGKKVLPVDCGTAFCFAGWTCQLDTQDTPRWASHDALWPNSHDPSHDVYAYVVMAEVRARRLLDLEEEEADVLFDGDNKLADLVSLVSQIKDGVEDPTVREDSENEG
jgi:hypothetical protein